MSDESRSQQPTRYAQQQEKLHQQERHAAIVARLGEGTVEEFERALADLEEPTPCIASGTPSEWTDWDIEPHNREAYEGKIPTASRAREMCEGCPLMKNDVCYRYALATNKQHGIWGGRRFHNGFVVSDGRDSPDRPNRERHKR